MTATYGHMAHAEAYQRPPRGWKRSRSVRVQVLVDGQEQDSFEASSPQGLRDTYRRLAACLPWDGASVRLLGVEEESLPLGLERQRRETSLASIEAALAFLRG